MLRSVQSVGTCQESEIVRGIDRRDRTQRISGFKLYPPMGFAPWGNQKLGEKERPPIWSKQGPGSPGTSMTR